MSEQVKKNRRIFAAGALTGALLTGAVIETPHAVSAVVHGIAHENDAAPLPDLTKPHKEYVAGANEQARALAHKAFPTATEYNGQLLADTKMIQEQGVGEGHQLVEGQAIELPMDAQIGSVVDPSARQ